MQRRRLGPLARVVFQVLGDCADSSAQEPVVFSSMMGEINRTQDILQNIASEQPVSPTAFSLAVHNSIGGLWSLVHKIHAPMNAISSSYGSPVAGLIEATGILCESPCSAVNLVFYEENFPDFYSPFFSGPRAPSALAIRLVPPQNASKECAQITLAPANSQADSTAIANPLALLPLLVRSSSEITLPDHQSTWQLKIAS